jgi:hypothetical protein
MDSGKTEYQPLATSSDEGHDGPAVVKHFEARRRKERWGKITLGVCLLAIIISNGVWTAVYRRHKHIHGESPPPAMAVSIVTKTERICITA